jgi:hypothetical protein
MAKVIPMHCEPSFAERLTMRRAYRQRALDVASSAVGQAFSESLQGQVVDLNDALPLFVAAMRRELRKSGLL